MPKLILFSAVWVFTILLVRSKKKKQNTEEFEINMWRKMCHVLSAKIVYVVRLHHSEHRVTPKNVILPTLGKSTEKRKIYSQWLVCSMCSVRNLGKCTLNYKRKVLNKLFWLSWKIKGATWVRRASFKGHLILPQCHFGSTVPQRTWANSFTYTCNTVGDKLPWKFVKPIESKAFTRTKQLSGHASPKSFFSPLEPEFNLESFSFLLETRLAVELFTSG